MALDIKFASDDKIITDSELVLYKRPDLTVKEMAALRKKSISDASDIIALQKVVEYIRDNANPSDGFNMDMVRGFDKPIRQLCRQVIMSPAFKSKQLRCEPWMLSFIFKPKYTKPILTNASKTNITGLFGLTNREIRMLIQAFA